MGMAGGVLSYPSLSLHPRRASSITCSSSKKHAERLLSSLHTAVSSDEDPAAAADRLISKFVASSSKSVTLHTLSRLLSRSSSSSQFAVPMYRKISEFPWFRWNPKLAAGVVPLLEKLGSFAEAENLIIESVSKLKPRELALFYCDLIESYAQHGLKDKAFDSYSRLRELRLSAGRRAYEATVRALCLLDSPNGAEEAVKEMGVSGFRPSPFEYRLVVQAYGRSGLFSEMRRVLGVMQDAGCALDTVCANVVLSCYGDHGELSEMVSWLGKMRESGIPFSVRTYNSVLNSCPRLVSMLRDLEGLPLSIVGLVERLKEEEEEDEEDEALLVRELVSSNVLVGMLEWTPWEGKLDLHGCHLGSAFLIILQWAEELKDRLRLVACTAAAAAAAGGAGAGKDVPLEISIVCGSGKHRNSRGRGESPVTTVRELVSEMMFRMTSPLRIDRKNGGRFVARGKRVREWLC